MQNRISLTIAGAKPTFRYGRKISAKQTALVKWAQVDDHQAILDLDCFDGLLLKHYLELYQVRACGIAASSEEAEASKELLGNQGEVLRANWSDIPFMSQSFDHVFISRLGQRLVPFDSTIAEVRRIIKPNGMLLITIEAVPVRVQLRKWFGRNGGSKPDPYQVMQQLENNGFQDISLRFSGLRHVTILAKNPA